MKRNLHFTLVELLVAIGIVVVLAGILIPTVSSAVKKAETAKARAEMTTLVNAIRQFEATYGRLPRTGAKDDGFFFDANGELNADNYENFIKMLQGDEGQVGASGSEKKENPRKIKFLDVQVTEGQYADPWDADYKVKIDTTGKNEIANGSYFHGLHDATLRMMVAVWSAGPDGEDAETATDAKNRDNVFSFPAEYDRKEGYWTLTH